MELMLCFDEIKDVYVNSDQGWQAGEEMLLPDLHAYNSHECIIPNKHVTITNWISSSESSMT